MRCAWCGVAYVGKPGVLWGTCCVCRPKVELAYVPEIEKEAKVEVESEAK